MDIFFDDSYIPKVDPDYFIESERIAKEKDTEPDLEDKELRKKVLKRKEVNPQEERIPIRRRFEEGDDPEKVGSPFLRFVKDFNEGRKKLSDELELTEEEKWYELGKENEYLKDF